jgi:hypothetical protein
MTAPQDDRPIADASSFFDDPDPRGPDPEADSGEGPDLGGYELADHGDNVPRAPQISPTTPPVPPTPRQAGSDSRPKGPLTPAPVDRPWTRLAEWGPALGRIAVVVVVTLGLAYLAFSPERLGLSLVVVAVGLAIAVLLSYPIAITLERPVRMAPEHAIRDYYAALAHHMPHHRRMWLLLSSEGRAEPEFRSLSSFRSYWNRQLAFLRGGKGWAMTPVSIRIEDFKSEKSAGLDAIEATYTISVFLRGRESEGPLFSTRTDSTLSRGPDRMWYLDDGRLPGR